MTLREVMLETSGSLRLFTFRGGLGLRDKFDITEADNGHSRRRGRGLRRGRCLPSSLAGRPGSTAFVVRLLLVFLAILGALLLGLAVRMPSEGRDVSHANSDRSGPER
jgi:hypothetical protein